MTFFDQGTSEKADGTNPIIRQLASAVLGAKRFALKTTKQDNSKPRKAILKSETSISQDVVTKLSIRAGITAGPW